MGESGVSVAGIALEGGKVFIARRPPGGDLGEKWEFPGGKVEDGETEEEALIREYREELGVPIRSGPLLGSASFEHQGKTRTLRAYRVYFTSHNFTLAEHSQWDWVSPEILGGPDFAGSDALLIPCLKDYLERESRVHDV
jgi:8-oxo-dGTP diphosphatase